MHDRRTPAPALTGGPAHPLDDTVCRIAEALHDFLPQAFPPGEGDWWDFAGQLLEEIRSFADLWPDDYPMDGLRPSLLIPGGFE